MTTESSDAGHLPKSGLVHMRDVLRKFLREDKRFEEDTASRYAKSSRGRRVRNRKPKPPTSVLTLE